MLHWKNPLALSLCTTTDILIMGYVCVRNKHIFQLITQFNIEHLWCMEKQQGHHLKTGHFSQTLIQKNITCDSVVTL